MGRLVVAWLLFATLPVVFSVSIQLRGLPAAEMVAPAPVSQVAVQEPIDPVQREALRQQMARPWEGMEAPDVTRRFATQARERTGLPEPRIPSNGPPIKPTTTFLFNSKDVFDQGPENTRPTRQEQYDEFRTLPFSPLRTFDVGAPALNDPAMEPVPPFLPRRVWEMDPQLDAASPTDVNGNPVQSPPRAAETALHPRLVSAPTLPPSYMIKTPIDVTATRYSEEAAREALAQRPVPGQGFTETATPIQVDDTQDTAPELDMLELGSVDYTYTAQRHRIATLDDPALMLDHQTNDAQQLLNDPRTPYLDTMGEPDEEDGKVAPPPPAPQATPQDAKEEEEAPSDDSSEESPEEQQQDDASTASSSAGEATQAMSPGYVPVDTENEAPVAQNEAATRYYAPTRREAFRGPAPQARRFLYPSATVQQSAPGAIPKSTYPRYYGGPAEAPPKGDGFVPPIGGDAPEQEGEEDASFLEVRTAVPKPMPSHLPNHLRFSRPVSTPALVETTHAVSVSNDEQAPDPRLHWWDTEAGRAHNAAAAHPQVVHRIGDVVADPAKVAQPEEGEFDKEDTTTHEAEAVEDPAPALVEVQSKKKPSQVAKDVVSLIEAVERVDAPPPKDGKSGGGGAKGGGAKGGGGGTQGGGGGGGGGTDGTADASEDGGSEEGPSLGYAVPLTSPVVIAPHATSSSPFASETKAQIDAINGDAAPPPPGLQEMQKPSDLSPWRAATVLQPTAFASQGYAQPPQGYAQPPQSMMPTPSSVPLSMPMASPTGSLPLYCLVPSLSSTPFGMQTYLDAPNVYARYQPSDGVILISGVPHVSQRMQWYSPLFGTQLVLLPSDQPNNVGDRVTFTLGSDGQPRLLVAPGQTGHVLAHSLGGSASMENVAPMSAAMNAAPSLQPPLYIPLVGASSSAHAPVPWQLPYQSDATPYPVSAATSDPMLTPLLIPRPMSQSDQGPPLVTAQPSPIQIYSAAPLFTLGASAPPEEEKNGDEEDTQAFF